MIRVSLLRSIANDRSDDLALDQGRAVMHGHDTDLVVSILDDHRPEAAALGNHFGHITDGFGLFLAERDGVNPFLGDDDELHQVDGVRAFTQDAALRAALSAILKETFHILKILDSGVGGQHLGWFKLTAVTGEHIADLTLGNGHQRHSVDYVLDRHQVMQTTA